jgi:hypothetical protein
MKATCFLHQSDPQKYGELVQQLKNRYAMGKDEYPRTMEEAYNLLMGWKPTRGHDRVGGQSDAATFTTAGDNTEEGITNVTKGPGKGRAHIQRHKCKKFGHFKDECDQRGNDDARMDDQLDGAAGAANVTYGVAMASAGEKKPIPDTWILLGKQSTVDLFKN